MICPQRFVRHAADRLGPVFLVPAARDGLIALAQSLPDAATGHILECRLDGAARSADYSAALVRSDGGFNAMQAAAQSLGGALGRAAAALAEADSSLSDAGVIWLEFDVNTGGGTGPPSIFASPDQNSSSHAQAVKLAAGLYMSLGLFPSPNVAALLERLPEGVFLRQAGVMTGRDIQSDTTIRLVLDGIKPVEILPLLDILGWPGPPDRARRMADIADRYCAVDRCRVDLDLGKTLAPSLGIELPGTGLCATDALCEELADLKLGTTKKVAALAKHAQRRTIWSWNTIDGPSRLDFGLNHIKLSLAEEATNRITAKAYFSLVATPDFAAMRP